MAENETTTKVQDQTPEGAPEGDNSEELLSLDNLDSILAEEDPEFAKSISEIGPDDPSLSVVIEEADLEYHLEDEIKYWKESSGWRKRLAVILPFVPKIAFKVKLARLNLRLSMRKFKESARENIRHLGPNLLSLLKNAGASVGGALSHGLIDFKGFPLAKKLAFVGLVLITAAGGVVIFKVATHKLIPASEELFVSSLEEWAQDKYFYDPKSEVESFYDSTRAEQNMFIIKKMVVNLRRSPSSGSNPMGAFEFFVEGTDSEVVVEIKDREPEVKDLFLRTIGDMTFDQISTGEGKQLMNDRLRKEINKILTKGKVRRVFIKTAVIKP
ncbi:MAG: flagellar basal body-associated protein FliL [Bacillota bacterium]